jgi:hypothetical protein
MERMIDDAPCQLCMTHSTLVTRVFEAAMKLRGIPAGDICSLSRRGAPFRGVGLRIDDISDEMEECFRKFDRKGYQAVSRRLDEILCGFTGGRPFEVHVPHANKIIYQEIILHRDCAAYSYLEEGFTSMAWSSRRNARSSLPKILRSCARSWRVGALYRFTRPMFDVSLPHYRAAYAISGLAFQGMPGRVDVAAHVPPLPAGKPPGNIYIILDAIYLFQGIRWKDYEDALVAAVLGSELPAGELLVKFHSADAGAREKFDSLRRHFEGGDVPPLRMLSGDFPVEEYLTGQDLLLFAVTALGYYAALAGTRVACFAERIKGLSLPSLIADGKLPQDFERIAGLAES